MFRGVDLAFNVQNLLRSRNSQVVNELMAEVAEAGAETRARCGGHPGAPRAPVQVETKVWLHGAQGLERWWDQFVDTGVAFEDRAESIFHHDGDAKIGTRPFENFESGRSEDAIAERAQ